MQNHFSTQQEPTAGRLGYVWLALGALFSLFAANGRFDLSLAAWLSPLFLLRFTRTSSPRAGFTFVWLASAGSMLFFLYQSQLLDDPLVIIVCLLLSTLLTLPYLLDRLMTPRLMLGSGVLATLLFPLSRVAFEYLTSFTPTIGGIFSLAYTQYGNLPLLQLVSVTGVSGVSFLIAWFASVGNWAWEHHFSWSRIRVVTLLYSGLLALVLLGGSIRLTFFAPSGQTVRVAGISAPASMRQLLPTREQMVQMLKTDPSQLRSQLATYDNGLLDLSRTEARAGAKIVVWPEVGGYVLASDKAGLLERAETLTRQEGIYLDMGLAVFQLPTTYYDQAILVDPQGQVDWTYNKTYPAPGDPEKPGDGIVPVVATSYGHVANVICFDADFPGLMREADSKGIDIMLVPGNDWQAIDPWHSQHVIFPAIENGYSLVRQASNGLAMTVDYQGHVLAATDYFTTDEQIMVASVPVKGVWTVYSAVGDLFAWLCIIGFLLLTGGVIWRAKTGQKLASPVMEGDRPLILAGKGSAPLNN